MRLRELWFGDIERINQWRNESKVGLRTNGPETLEKQQGWYSALPNRNDMRFWAIEDGEQYINTTDNGVWIPLLVGQGGFVDISLENKNAEISLIINTKLRGKGYGEQAVDLLLEQAFNYMNLENVYGEVYDCNDEGVLFWTKIIDKYNSAFVELKDRKYWDGKYYKGLYFTIQKFWWKEIHARNKV